MNLVVRYFRRSNFLMLVALLTFRVVFARLNVSAGESNRFDNRNSSTSKLISLVDLLVRRENIRLSVIVDPDAVAFCEKVVRTLHVAAKTSIRTYASNGNYSENPFSKLNVLCFRRDDNVVSFAASTRTFVSSNSFNMIVLMQDESRAQVERLRVSLLQSKNFNIWPHTVLVSDEFVKAIHPSHTAELTIDGRTTVRDVFGIRNFGGRSLRVTQFVRIPEVTETKSGFLGSSYNVMTTLAEYLNFTPIVANATDGERFGDLVNGTFTGALADIVYNRTDMVMNGNFLQEPQSDLYWYTVPVNFEQVCVIQPKADKLPHYLTPFKCLSPRVWLMVKITFVTVCCVHYLSSRLGYVYLLQLDEYQRGISDSIITTLSATINVPLALSRFGYPAVRVLLIVYLSFMYVLVSAFRASLVTLLTVPMYYDDVDSLAELKESGQLKQLWTFSKSILKSFRSVELKDDPILSELREHLRYVDLNDSRSHDPSASFLGRSLYSHAKFLDNFMVVSEDEGVAAFHRVKECPMSYYVAYMLPKKFPYVDEVNTIITRTIESGLVAKWDGEVVQYSLTDDEAPFRLRLFSPRVYVLKFESQPRKFSMEHLQIAFYALLAGWSVSACAFLTEIGSARIGNKKIAVPKRRVNKAQIRKFRLR